ATLGTTSSTAIDPLRPIAEICRDENIWLHVDAAYAGTALLLPEYRWMIDGVDLVDSFVFNPHKWLFTNFDCSVYYVKEKEVLINTFAILPEYLRTASHGKVNNYCDWHIQLGRRFRSLKLWFVLRSFGLEGIRQKLRHHISLAAELEKQIAAHPDFELLAPRHLNLLCFRYRPAAITDPNLLNQMNESLLQSINASGKAYLTHTKLNETFTLRLVLGNTGLEERHVEEVWKLIRETAGQIR
ncbi:MAG: aspartate aminotransferase family protein, partial [Bacteroidetes bacterium]|nr:aspartate aminotransferase family protein [Bacteroidota bacterium]